MGQAIHTIHAGAVNRTLLTVQVARSAALTVAGVVINRYRIDPATARALEKGTESPAHADEDLIAYTNPPQIAARGRTEVLTIVPEDGESSVEKATLGSDVQFAVAQVDWGRIMKPK